jgi:hypothetical protein
MKIKLVVDAAYAFDFLSILEVKSNKSKLPSSEEALRQKAKEIYEQIGFDLFNKIIDSQEYLNLYKTNEFLFDLIDKMKEDPDSVKAIEVDKSNYDRFLYKKALQEKFFNDQLLEEKIGYEK